MIAAQKTGEWRQAVQDFATFARKFKTSAKRAVSKEAHHWATEIKKGIRTQRSAGKARPPWAPLAAATIKRKGSTKMLIDTGTMLRSIGAEKIADWKWLVGVKRGAKSADGEEVVNIAAVHEFGYSIKSGRSGGETIVIPARPFIGPVYDELSKDVDKRVLERFAKEIAKNLTKKEIARVG